MENSLSSSQNSTASIDEISKIFLKTAQKMFETSTLQEVSYASVIQAIPKVAMRPDLTSFVQFDGDYAGLVILNFTAGAALEIYKTYMTTMGIPEDELDVSISSPEVADTIGELTNQLMGQLVKEVEDVFDLNASFGQPKALTMNRAITLVIDGLSAQNRRLSMKIGTYSFMIELAMEHTEFIRI